MFEWNRETELSLADELKKLGRGSGAIIVALGWSFDNGVAIIAATIAYASCQVIAHLLLMKRRRS